MPPQSQFGAWPLSGADAGTGSGEGSLSEVVIIGITPIPGTSIDIDKIPGNVQVSTSADLTREGLGEPDDRAQFQS